MAFLKEYNKGKKQFIYGTDYVDFRDGNYLLFIPLTRKVLTMFHAMRGRVGAFNYIAYHNCIIGHSIQNVTVEWHYNEYVRNPYLNEGFYKCFLIDLKKINCVQESKIGTAFVSFNFKPEGLQLNSAVYDGLGHYYNLDKIHKSKYYKEVGGNVNEVNKHFYQEELSPLLDKLLGKMIAEKDGKFDYKVDY